MIYHNIHFKWLTQKSLKFLLFAPPPVKELYYKLYVKNFQTAATSKRERRGKKKEDMDKTGWD